MPEPTHRGAVQAFTRRTRSDWRRARTRSPSPSAAFPLPPPPYSSGYSLLPRSDSSDWSFYADILPTLIKLLIGVGFAFIITYLASFTVNSAHRRKVIEIMSDKAAAECLLEISRNNYLLFAPINCKSLDCSSWLPYLTDRAICKLERERLKIIGERASRGLYV
jgi:hypothetical protein